MEASSGGIHVPKIMTFRPTWEEFKDFNKYVEYIESQGAHKAGVCKIIPPKEWVPRKAGYDDVDLIIPAPIQQVVHGKQGLYTQLNVQKKPISVKDFEKMANRNSYRTPKHTDYDDLERRYWKNITFVNPIYGADVSGSITDHDQESWNIQKLGSILDCLGDDYGISIEGVNTAYLYFGMWKTTFAWHTEDMDLYSINYVHYGAPKRWYAIPPEHGRRFERLAKGFFSENSESCPAFLRHKMSLISPTMLKRYSIPCDTVVQEAGEIMITFPFGYHSGFNHGFNCAESTNFASRRWIEYGKRCTMCHCRKDSVKIDMGPFVKRFQPKLYDLWVSGKDSGPHPEDDKSRLYNHHHSDMVSSTSPSTRMKRSSDIIDEIGGDAADSPTNGSPVKKHKSKDKSTARSVTKSDAHSDSGCWDVGSELRAPAHSKVYQPDMDAPTDVSDALTDVELEVAVPHSSTNDEGQGQAEAHTFTRPSKPKHRKCTPDDSDLAVVKFPWAKSLTRLWKFNPPDFEAEKRYNRRMGQRKPFCAICSVICRRDDESAPVKAPRTKPPDSTTPLLPPSCFASPEEALQMPPPKSPKQRPLLVCKECNVCVHDTCYGGVKFLHNGPKNWQCTRCTQQASSAECVLCCLRGGALKPTTDDKWVHIVCAIANTEVSFSSASSREPISIIDIDKARGSLKCSYCGNLTHMNGKDRYGKCVQCTTGQCSKSFHLTCARAAGLRIDLGTGALRLHVTCNKHTDSMRKEELASRPDLHVSDEVYARYKNGRYYKGEITNICTQLYYCVLFEDNSFSRDLFPEDILNHPVSSGPPPMAEPVSVKWTDGIVYNGLFQGTRSIVLYTVSFEDGSEIQLEKDQVYSIHEQLPTSVQKKLSRATEMRNDVFYRKDSDLLTETRTRGVQVNYNYKWEFMHK